MKHALIWIFILALGWAVPAMAQTDVSAPVVKMLQDEGYMVSEVRRTWLGRILIIAKKGAVLREVVLNRKSGAILNDQIFGVDTAASASSKPFGLGTHDPGNENGPDGGVDGGSGPGGGGGSSPGEF